MCPVAGGALSFESRKLREALNVDLPSTEMALRFVLSNPNVSTACSGMSTSNNSSRTSAPSRLRSDESSFEEMCAGLDRLRATLGPVLHRLRYCMPCRKRGHPLHLEITATGTVSGWTIGRVRPSEHVGRKIPDQCTECGVCEESVPTNWASPRCCRNWPVCEIASRSDTIPGTDPR